MRSKRIQPSLSYRLVESKLFERLYFGIFPKRPRHGVNCECNCGNWQGQDDDTYSEQNSDAALRDVPTAREQQ